jgi:hypothetical protein
MSTITTATAAPPRELDHRAVDGIEVTLLWHPYTDRLTVEVDAGDNRRLTIPIRPDDSPSDVFAHPFFHAAMRGML